MSVVPSEKQGSGASEIPQWVRVLAEKPGALNSIPETHLVERANQFPQLPSDLHTQDVAYTRHTEEVNFKNREVASTALNVQLCLIGLYFITAPTLRGSRSSGCTVDVKYNGICGASIPDEVEETSASNGLG